MVHYVNGDKHYAAIVTDVLEGDGEVGLCVHSPTSVYFTQAKYDANKAPYTWHWIEGA
jgi:hypothetical protein